MFKVKKEIFEEKIEEEPIEPKELSKLSEKEELEVVYKFLKDRGLNSINDVKLRLFRL